MTKERTINGGGASIPNNQGNPLGEFTPDRITRTTGQSLSAYSLSTSAQTVVGAINEILPKATGVGKVDPNSDDTGEIFNDYSKNHAEGSYAHAEGSITTASGSCSHAEGYITTASSTCSHAEGYDTTASDHSAHAEGYSTTASGSASHAEGRDTTASGDAAHAEGHSTTASGYYSHAEGRDTTASGYYSHVEGYGTQSENNYEHAEGQYNVSNSSAKVAHRTIHSVGIGTSVSDRKNAHEIMANGDHYIYGVGGYNGTNAVVDTSKTLQEVINSKQETITAGTGLEFEGNTLNVTLDTTVFYVVETLPVVPDPGNENKICLVPTDNVSTLATAPEASFPEPDLIKNEYTEYIWTGSNWEELGKYYSEVDLTPYLKTSDAADTYLSKTDAASTYLNKTDASSNYLAKTAAVGRIDSTSDGTGEIFNSYEDWSANVASGDCSHAEGFGTKAEDVASHAEGSGTKAGGVASHAEGSGTKAEGDCSHAEGYGTNATGVRSHAEGNYTNALNRYEHAEGSYNVSNTGDTEDLQTRHSVGIGTGTSNRKNAHEIMANGDHYVFGLGGYDGTNATSEDSKTLQTVVTELQTSITTIQSKQTVYTEVPELTADYQIPANATMVEKIYMITIGATIYDVTGAADIKWAGGVTPTASANSILVVSVLNNLATWQTFI